MPPQNDDQTPRPSANPGSPFRAIGNPSKVVATDDGVPGIPVRIPDINPPESPPTRTETIVARPCSGGIEKVNGSVSTTAIAIVNPGIDPASKPAATPIIINRIVSHCPIAENASKTLSQTILQNPVHSPRGRITFNANVNTDHIPPTVINAIETCSSVFRTPPRAVSSRNTNAIPPSRMPT